MSHPGEIITFQVGNYANFVGAHFFNLQDPVRNPEHDSYFNTLAFWREGHNAQRQRVVTPRVLMFDLKDNWRDKFVQKSNDRPNTKAVAVAGTPTPTGASQHVTTLDKIEKEVSWDGKVQRVILPHDSSDSEDSETSSSNNRSTKKVKQDSNEYDFGHWGDYAQWRLHNTEKCAFRIPNFMYNSESDELVSYGQGLGIYHKLEEIVEDGIRLYAEDCDHLEGFHMLVDEYDGFTGISGGILEHLGDEYDKKACLGLGLNRPLPESSHRPQGTSLKDHKIRISNTVQLWSAFSRHARVFSSFGLCEDTFCLNPVARKFPGIIQDCSLPTVSSAILAATLDSLTAPYRLNSPSFPLHEMTSLLNAFGHKMALIGSTTPFPLNKRTLFKALNEDGFSALTSFCPNVNIDLDKSIGNVFVMRGFSQDQIISPSESREYKQMNINSVTTCSELYCQESYPRSVHVIKDIPVPFKVSYPYPNLYEKSYLEMNSRPKPYNTSQGEAWLVPAMASAHNTPLMGTVLERIVSITGGGSSGSMMKMKSFYEPSSRTCNSATFEFEDYAECVNDLSSLQDSYSKD